MKKGWKGKENEDKGWRKEYLVKGSKVERERSI